MEASMKPFGQAQLLLPLLIALALSSGRSWAQDEPQEATPPAPPAETSGSGDGEDEAEDAKADSETIPVSGGGAVREGDNEGDAAASSEKPRDPRVPFFTTLRPSWAFQLHGSSKAMGGTDLSLTGEDVSPRAFAMQFEYQPPFLQDFGVFSLGPSLGIYPFIPRRSGVAPTSGTLSIWEVGGQLRYQARFFREQPIVPVLGYSLEYIRYTLADGTDGSVVAQGPFVGALLLLNIFDPGGAAGFYTNFEVLRSYVAFEYRMLSGSDPQGPLTFSGGSLFFGLRFEF
jgi:hypothetical protein